MRLVVRALTDPAFEQFFFGSRQREMRVRRRHQVVFVLGEDAADKFAVFDVAGFYDSHPVFEFLQRAVALIETQLGFARSGVRPVTAEATIREQRTNLEIEIHRRNLRRRRRDRVRKEPNQRE